MAKHSTPVRFLTLDDVAAELAISRSQTYALVRRAHLPAVKIGGRGQWRIERAALEDYITTAKRDAAAWITDRPYNPSPESAPGAHHPQATAAGLRHQVRRPACID